MNVEEMYQEIILDHYREKHHSGLRDPYQAQVTHVNPSCGDELMLRVNLESDTVVDVSYDAVGCSISQASTSVMTDLVIGHDVGHGFELFDEFVKMMESRGRYEPDEEQLEDGVAFVGVSKFPNRVKCATLGWYAFKDAVVQAQAASDSNTDDRATTEGEDADEQANA